MTQDSPEPASKYATAKSTLLWNRIMSIFISVGGIAVIVSVLLICFFIVIEIIPILRGANVRQLSTFEVPDSEYGALACDQYTQFPLLIAMGSGDGVVVDIAQDGKILNLDAGLPEGVKVTAINYSQRYQELVYGTDDGRFCAVKVDYEETFTNNKRSLSCSLQPGPLYHVGQAGGRIISVSYADASHQEGSTESVKIVALVQEIHDKRNFYVAVLKQKRSMLSEGVTKVASNTDLTPKLLAAPQHILVNAVADTVIASDIKGNVYYFFRNGSEMKLIQRFQPFGDLEEKSIHSIDFVFGDASLVVTNAAGKSRIFSIFVPDAHTQRLFGHTRTLPNLSGPATAYAGSMRNKSFLMASGNELSLRYGTSAEIRWQAKMPYKTSRALISSKYDHMLIVDDSRRLHLLKLDDPFPEAGFKAFFGRIWYDSKPYPSWTWQSTGSSDEYEPKISLVPIVVGTLKGTLYAMIFAVPIALLAALYVSRFQAGAFRKVVKPTMEVMASLPSVVLGFIGALWLAPIVEQRIPAVLLFIASLPIVAVICGTSWSSLPKRFRRLIPDGWEFIAAIPLVIGCWLLADAVGPIIESWWFVVKDPDTGLRVADFRLWWPEVTGTKFDGQRNALLVGFMMGFAVIPIIFTIAEDALSNVPATLVSASDALGATRWQTAIRVVLPTASAGVFSAIMMGLGRAVGETMIVLMISGNTPVMDVNPFSGMRTLSTNIAVELPEAPQGETLYRTLFLGAFMLFLMTWVINTFAEVLRQRLIKKYRTL